VYRSVLDRDAALLIGRFSGASNTDDDFERYLASIREADQGGMLKPGGIAVLLVDRGNPRPSAPWRKRIADETAHIRAPQALFVLCTSDALIRGVVVAINWLRPPGYEARVVATPPDVIALIRARRPTVGDRAAELITALLAEP
jgi:hypothetical protein